MAKKLSEIYVDFTGRLGKLKTAMSKAKGMVKKSMTSLGRIAKRGALVLGAALVAGLTMAVKAFVSFEQQIAKVATMLDEATMHLIPKYARAIKDLAIRFGEGTASIAEGLYQILSASIPVTKALKVLRWSMMAAKAGFTDTATAAYALTGVMNAYGYAADKVSKVSDILFLIQKRGQTSFGQFAPVLGRVTSIAAAMGVKLEEVAAALAILTKSGISTAESITYLRGLIVSLAGRSKEGIEIAQKYGVELSAEAVKRKQISGMLKELLPLSADVLKKVVSETEARTGLVVLLGKQAEFEKVLNEAMTTSGLTMEAHGIVAETLGEKFKKLWQVVKMFAVDLATTFVPIIKRGVIAITATFSDMRDKLGAIWFGTGEDFEKFINILWQILSVKMRQLIRDMKSYGRLAGDAFFSAFHDRAVEWNKKNMKWTYAALHKRWEKEEKERKARLEEGIKVELDASKKTADAELKAVLKESNIQEGYEEHLDLLARERAERDAEDAAERVKGEEDETKRLETEKAKRERLVEELAADREKAINAASKKEREAYIDKLQKLRDMYKAMKGYDKEYAKVQRLLWKEQAEEYAKTGLVTAKEAFAGLAAKEKPMADAAEAAKTGFVRFEAAWGNIVSQLMEKKVEERQLSKLEELVMESKKFTVGIEQVRRAIEADNGGFTV